MSYLWVQKYQPTSVDALTIHPGLTTTIEHLAAEDDVPHLLLYGPAGAGKKARVAALLQELFGPSVHRVRVDSRQLSVSKDSSRKIEMTIVSSVHHAEITPAESGNQDRVVIQEFLKEMAQTQQVDVTAKHRFKVVVINEADRLTRDAQAALRRTMEIYSGNLRLILIATSTSGIMAPIRSRTLLLRVPAPTVDEITRVLGTVADRENLEIEDRDATLAKVAGKSGRNLRKALLMLQAMHANNARIAKSAEPVLADWEQVIDKQAVDIVKSHTVHTLASIRSTNYELLSHCIPASTILKTLLFALLARVDEKSKPAIIEYAALYDHRLKQGAKEIFHLEAFVARVMQTLQAWG